MNVLTARIRARRMKLSLPVFQARRVECPVCLEDAGSPCRRETGEPMTEVHVGRVRYWERWRP